MGGLRVAGEGIERTERLLRVGLSGVGVCLALFSPGCGRAEDNEGGKSGAGGAGVSASGGFSGSSTSSGGASASGGEGTGAAAGANDGSGGDTGVSQGGALSTGARTSGGTSSIGGGLVNGSGGSAGGRESCSPPVVLTPVAPVLEFLIDTSASMNQAAPNSTVTKYAATRDALVQTFNDLEDGSGAGLIFFPNTKGTTPSGGECILRQGAVPLAVLDATVRAALIAALMSKVPSGSTPTHDAYAYAVDTLSASPVQGDKYVVLVTDGAPTYVLACIGDGMTPVDSAPLVAAVAEAQTSRGIRTFVIGSPGSEAARDSLSRMASSGGTATPGCSDQGPAYCHFDMTTAPDLSAALNSALEAIRSQSASCNYVISAPPNGQAIRLDLVNIAITNAAGTSDLLPMDPGVAGGCARGWQYAANNTQIHLCADACAAVKSDPAAKVEMVLGCGGVTL